MQRNMDLVRNILLEAEKVSNPDDWFLPKIDGHSKEEIYYHVMILGQAGYLDTIDLSSSDGFEWQIKNLTWKGHEFLDSARDQNVWTKAKSNFGAKFSSVSFSILQNLLTEVFKTELGLK